MSYLKKTIILLYLYRLKRKLVMFEKEFHCVRITDSQIFKFKFQVKILIASQNGKM